MQQDVQSCTQKVNKELFDDYHFRKLDNYFERLLHVTRFSKLDNYGRKGVEALRSATPFDSGLTRDKWNYKIDYNKDSFTISFLNSNINDGVLIAIILQYGHGTRNGGYVQGIDYINPAIQPIFDQIVNEAWEEVTKL